MAKTKNPRAKKEKIPMDEILKLLGQIEKAEEAAVQIYFGKP